jgi:hypothetical protein
VVDEQHSNTGPIAVTYTTPWMYPILLPTLPRRRAPTLVHHSPCSVQTMTCRG